MKRLIFSDLHLHPWTYGATVNGDGFNSRLAAQWDAIVDMTMNAEEQGVKYAYFCGDLFHQHGTVPTQALYVAGELFKNLREAGIKIRAISGNHDQYDRQGKIHALNFLPDEEIKGTWVDEGLHVYSLPYTTDEEVLKRFLGDVGEGDGGMLLLHQGISGVPLGSGFVIDEKLSPEMIPDNCRAFAGHYHYHKAVTPNLTVVGNLTPLGWGDLDQPKGWVIWDDETGELKQKIQTASPNFISWGSEIADLVPIHHVRNAFVRYLDPINSGEQAEVRKALIKEGAITVEFPTMPVEEGTDDIRTGDDITIEHIVEVFDKQNDGRRGEIGVEIRGSNYEAPAV